MQGIECISSHRGVFLESILILSPCDVDETFDTAFLLSLCRDRANCHSRCYFPWLRNKVFGWSGAVLLDLHLLKLVP